MSVKKRSLGSSGDIKGEKEFKTNRSNITKQRKRPFWKNEIVYQIYPRSFCDKNEDGIGDIQGIISKVDYFVALGVGVIWLSPINKSPMKDFGYDISDYLEIDPIFGSIRDFDQLLDVLHSKGIRVVLDFVPNHTSDQHKWFIKSQNNDPKYKDYYLWKDPLGYAEDGLPVPPNNWLSVFRHSAWQWSEERKQFYLHHFLKEQPDLNFRNPDVVDEINQVMRFWLDRGVDGFRIDAVKYLFEIEDVYGADEPVDVDSDVFDPTQYEYLKHTHTINQPETFDVIKGWRKIIDEYSDRVMMVEVCDDLDKVMTYYGNGDEELAHFPFNFSLISNFQSRKSVTGIRLKENVELWLDSMPPGKWPNWVLGNHDNGRIASRLGSDLVDALNMFILLLPGTPITYYGEEIGMEDTFISFEETQDPWGLNYGPNNYKKYSRDPERTPMQWNESKFSGFTKGNTTWLPVNQNYKTVNVKAQNESEQSHLKVYKALTKLRRERVFQMGDLTFQTASQNVVAYVRSMVESETKFMLVINTSEIAQSVDATTCENSIPSTAKVLIRSSHDSRTETEIGASISTSNISLLPGEGLVLKLLENSL